VGGDFVRFAEPVRASTQEVLEELQAAHVRTFRTDINGVSCFLLDGKATAPDFECGR
jgi:hypothetical protein